MSRLTDVLDAARGGESPAAIATRLGVSRGLVDTMLGQGQRLGRLTIVSITGCSDGGSCAPGERAACAACPIRPARPRQAAQG